MSSLRVRTILIFNTLLTLAASFVFNIAVTRKLPLFDLGLLNLFTGAISLGSIPISIPSFMAPRLSARYKESNISLLLVSMLFGIVGSIASGVFLFIIRTEITTTYYYVILTLAVLSIMLSSMNSVFTGGLTVFNRPRMLYVSIITAIVKMGAIVFILDSNWSLFSVLISSFVITLSGTIYAGISLTPYVNGFGDLRRAVREVLSGSWVPLIGYATSNISSLDTFIIAAIGGVIDNAIWEVMSMIASLYSFASTFMSITYGELLQNVSHERKVYMDFLVVLLFASSISLFVVYFEPYVITFLRPTNVSLIGELAIPIIIWSTANIINTSSQYISNIMQGIDRVDMSAKITPKVYWKSMVFYAHLAEFITAVSYVALIYPMIISVKDLGISFYVIDGVIIAQLIATIISLTIRINRFPSARNYLMPKELIRDYAIPTVATGVALYLIRIPVDLVLHPTVSAVGELAILFLIFLIVIAVYLGIGLLLSPRIRSITRAVTRRYVSYIKRHRP